MLKEVVRLVSAPLRNCTETEFEVSLKGRKVWRCFVKLASDCCKAPEAMNLSSIGYEAGRYYPRVRCAISFEDTVQGTNSLSRLMTVTTETQRKAESLKEAAGMARERGTSGKNS